MAYISSFIDDAENILDQILEIQDGREYRIHSNYKAARTIQRWFRGYITRKHIQFLHEQATIIQKYWRGHHSRHLYFLLLKQKVKEFEEESYNRLATLIQKMWRGYVYREYVFSYLKLKRWKISILKKNRFMLQIIKNYEESTWSKMCKHIEKESEEWLAYILFKTHHLLRTVRIKGVYSLKNNKKLYSPIEELLRLIKFTDYMTEKRKVVVEKETPNYQYKSKGVYRKCEDAWRKRYEPNIHSVFSSGVYEEELEEAKFNEAQAQDALIIQENRMKFGIDSCKCNEDSKETLNYKPYECPPKHMRKIAFDFKLLDSVLQENDVTDYETRRLQIVEVATNIVNEIIKKASLYNEDLMKQASNILDILTETKEEICELENK